MDRWLPVSEEDIRAVIGTGALVERHHLDVKREIGDTEGDRKELARDIAAFALDGGMLLIGVSEDKQHRTWSMHPGKVAGVREKIAQIAQQRIDPPVAVRTSIIPSDQHPSLGYVVIEVDPSPVAPHMVGGVYHGRSDTTRTRLSDIEVRRHHHRREDTDRRINALLNTEVDRSPLANHVHNPGLIFMVAQPDLTHDSIADDFVWEQSSLIRRMVTFSGERRLHPQLRNYQPTPVDLASATRADGIGFHNRFLTDDRSLPSTERPEPQQSSEWAFDVEVRHDGGIRLFSGGLVRQPVENFRERCITEGLVVAHAARLVAWTSELATLTGYHGRWLLGVHCIGLAGHTSTALYDEEWFGTRYSQPAYRSFTTASQAELDDIENPVVHKLIDRFLRGLGSYGKMAQFVSYEPPQ